MSTPAPQPLFLDGPQGRLFAVLYGTASGAGPAVLYLPPFAEEMNRARRMAALLGRSLAARGASCLVLDLYGTGDSAGAFEDTRWPVWRADAEAALTWLRARGYRDLSVVGLRLGACLALEAAAGNNVRRAVLWQPVVRGRTFLDQFLRIRVATAVRGADADAGPETTRDLRARLDAGETLEVAGYALHPHLAAAIDGLRLEDMSPGPDLPVTWFETAPEADASLRPASARVVERWHRAGCRVEARTVAGPAFWTIEETTLSNALLERTAGLWAAEG